MTRAAVPLPLAIIALSGCMAAPAYEPLTPDRDRPVDTITIVRTAEPPTPSDEPLVRTDEPLLSEERPVMVCLATGHNVQVHVSPAGDTLVGPRRVPLVDLGPLLGFVGEYAASEAWFVHDRPILFDRRAFAKAGEPAPRDCHDITVVGDFNGVNLFSDVDAPTPIRVLYVPVQPGLFQTYRSPDGGVRG